MLIYFTPWEGIPREIVKVDRADYISERKDNIEFKGKNVMDRNLLDSLCRNAQQYGLTIFVGSGINGEACPQWGELTSGMLEDALTSNLTEDPKLLTNKEDVKKWSKSYYDVYGIASLVKALAPDRYMELLRFHIYQHDFYDELVAYCKNKSIRSRDRSNLDRRYSLLKAVARLCISPLVNAIVTFNYDGLLDTAIEAVRAERSRTGKKSINSQRSSNPMIIRTHGYLSSPHSIFKGIDQDVVLSHDEYFEMQREPESMETSTPLHLLRNSAALFVGASLKDWNMLRLLEYASPEHEGCGTYCLLSEEDMGTLKNFGDEDLGRVAMRMHATLLNFFGVKLLSAGILRKNIPEEVDLIRESLLKPMDDVR